MRHKHIRLLLTIQLLTLAVIANAAPIGRQAARESAERFLASHGIQGTQLHALAAPPLPQRAKRKGASDSENSEPLHIFNIGEDAGFVIVSGDDRTPPILGYTQRGSFDAGRMPRNMLLWLDDCAAQIAALGKQPAYAQWAGGKPIPPMLQTQWNQDSPYNLFCPIYTDDNRCVAGCVAVAMAQVMNFHRWPTAPLQTSIPGNYNTYEPFVAGETVDAGTRFEWSLMIDSYDSRHAYSGANELAVAQLMAACGVAVETGYASWGSGSALARTATALTNYFDYSSAVHYVERRNFSSDTWHQMIYDELAGGRPVLYGGVSSDNGHVFVLDGYDGGGLFHVNWGWGGLSDGFYVLSVLNPGTSGVGGSASGDGYTNGQHAVIGVWPNDASRPFVGGGEAYYQDISLQLESYELPRGNVVTDREVELVCRIRNMASETFAGQIYLTSGNDLHYTTDYNPDQGGIAIPPNGTAEVTFTFLPDAAGTMHLSLWADLSRSDGRFADISLDVAENQSAPLSDIVFESVVYKYDTGEHHIHGRKLKGYFVVKNFNSTLDYDGDVAMVWYAYNAEDNNFQAFHTIDYHIYVPAGEECSFPFEVKNLKENTYMPFLRVNGINQTNGWDDVCYLDGLSNAIAATSAATGGDPVGSSANEPQPYVFDLCGRRMGRLSDASALPPGIYIVGGRKVHLSTKK